MKTKHTLIKGTLLLTITGFVSRIIGFYYRIFLSQTIGAVGIGIYQLIFPIYAICFSFTSAGIQTAISRLVAARAYQNDHKSSHRVLQVGLFLSLILSFLTSYFVFNNAEFLSKYILMDSRCTSLLRILSVSVPLGTIHSCINGYYYGMKKAGIPALSQLVEQSARVISVYLMYKICLQNNTAISIDLAVVGLVIGEFASMLVSVTALNLTYAREPKCLTRASSRILLLKSLITQSVPLTLNRVLLNVLQSTEAILIPSRLRLFGLDTESSLSVYGVLTGMALPLILFPSALTNSVSVMLLPAVAEAQAGNQNAQLSSTAQKTIKYCIILGIFCTGLFLALGRSMGTVLFHDDSVGSFIVTLAWICPFLYLSTTLSSIVHGLGKTTSSFICNLVSILIRICFVFFGIPKWGINGYLWGLLISQLLLSLLLMLVLNRSIKIHFQAVDWLVKPMASIALAIFITKDFNILFSHFTWMNGLLQLLATAGVFTIVYACSIILTNTKQLCKQ